MNETIIKSVDAQQCKLHKLASDIWENPELGFVEVKASGWIASYLEQNGFAVERGAYGIPTAIRAVWGSGKPVIGFCGEYDALPDLSQTHDTQKTPVEQGAPGHGCGHNLLGVSCAGAVVALKQQMEQDQKQGTVVYYGCPAEELLVGKGFMAKEGAFAECDIALSFHPAVSNQNTLGLLTGMSSAVFTFKGRTAHAAANPHDGRSALDAVEIMNVGVQFLREHVTTDVRMHYTITDGGLAPNIVPDKATVWYFVRALTREAVVDAYDRVVKCAQGAAHMTDTQLEIRYDGGCYPTMPNHVLVNLLQKHMEQIPAPTYTQQEMEYARQINKGNPYSENLPADASPIDTQLHPLDNSNNFASTDFGDVMHIVPAANLLTTCASTMAGGHSWMITACSGHDIGFKGMLYGSKVLASAAYECICNPAIITEAQSEFAKNMGGKQYDCPITDDVKKPF